MGFIGLLNHKPPSVNLIWSNCLCSILLGVKYQGARDPQLALLELEFITKWTEGTYATTASNSVACVFPRMET